MFVLLLLVAMVTISSCYENHADLGSKEFHDLENQKVIYDVELEQGHLVHKRSVNQRLRIHLQYDDSIHYLPADHQRLIKSKVEQAVAFWEDTLMIRSTGSKILLNRKCATNDLRYVNGVRYCKGACSHVTMCGDVRVPLEHLKGCQWWDKLTNQYHSSPDTQPGVTNKDFILYVAALPSDKCNWQQTVAYAAHCQQEKVLDRPVAGYFSICPDSVSTSIHKHEELLYTIKHEILHALGFTAALYAFYRDPSGYPLTMRDPFTNKPLFFNERIGMYKWSNLVAKEVTRFPWKLKGQVISKKVTLIVTPNVQREVRRHFNCPSLEGAELEDQGINGTALTHWEKRVFENEFMTGTFTQNPVISRISLAMMQDTGWYGVKYENAENLEWGQNLGCDFVMKSCFDWIESRLRNLSDIHPFCIKANIGQTKTDCTRNREAVAICNLSEYPNRLPAEYQYFSSIAGVHPSDVDRYGGSVGLADYCPYLQEFVWKQGEDIIRGSHCALPHNMLSAKKNYLLESYGGRSKCFNHPSGWDLYQCNSQFTPLAGSGCYQYTCSPTTGLTLFVGSKAYRCYFAGQTIKIEQVDRSWRYNGNVTCPSCTSICQEEGVMCPPDDFGVYTHVPQRSRVNIPCSAPVGGCTNLLLMSVIQLWLCFFL